MATIEIHGTAEAIELLGIAETMTMFRQPMRRAVARMRDAMAIYPPQRSGSAYRRSGTLGRRWTTRVTERSDGLEGKVGNNTSYGPFVQSQMFQATVHQGRWQTDQQVADEQEAAIVADFERAIQAALR